MCPYAFFWIAVKIKEKYILKLHTLMTQNIIRSLMFIIILFSISSQCIAAYDKEAQILIETTYSNMVSSLMENKNSIRKNPKVAHQLIDKHLLPIIDFRLASRWILGKNWKKYTSYQQQKFIIEFKQLLINFNSKLLIEYLQTNNLNKGIITFEDHRGKNKKKSKYASVKSHVNPPSGEPPIKVVYDLYFNEKLGKWHVYDVSIETLSYVEMYRSHFKKELKEKSLDELIK